MAQKHEQTALFGEDSAIIQAEMVEPVYEHIPAVDAIRVEFDPNARRQRQLRNADIGGGIATAHAAEVEVVEELEAPKGPIFEVPGVGKGRQNPYNQPVSQGEVKAAKRGLSQQQINAQVELNRTRAEEIKHAMVARKVGNGRTNS